MPNFVYQGHTFIPLRNLTDQENTLRHQSACTEAAGNRTLKVKDYDYTAFETQARLAGCLAHLYKVGNTIVMPTTPCIYHYKPGGHANV